jgi:cysteine-rich repeat protein
MFDTTGCTKCGDGVLDPGEACDDGNNTPGDGCDAACKIEMCDPNGAYQVQGAPIAYTCCNGLVSVNINSFTLANAGATITSSPSNPVPMLGVATTCPAGMFANQGSIPGGCTETYKVSGKFTDKNTWTGTYELVFTGNQCSCFQGMLGTPCVNQSFPVTAKR